MEEAMTGGTFLIRLRTKCGFSQQELADRMHTTRAIISRLENDQRIMEKVECSLMAEAYDIPSDVFIKAYRMALEGRDPFLKRVEGDMDIKPKFAFEEVGQPLEIAVNYPQPSNFIVVRYMSASDPKKDHRKLHPLIKSTIISAIILLMGLFAFISILCGVILPEMNQKYLAEHPHSTVSPIAICSADVLQLSAFYFITLFCIIAIEVIVYFTIPFIRKYQTKKAKKEKQAL